MRRTILRRVALAFACLLAVLAVVCIALFFMVPLIAVKHTSPPPTPHFAPQYKVIDIGPIPQQYQYSGVAINNRGHIIVQNCLLDLSPTDRLTRLPLPWLVSAAKGAASPNTLAEADVQLISSFDDSDDVAGMYDPHRLDENGEDANGAFAVICQ